MIRSIFALLLLFGCALAADAPATKPAGAPVLPVAARSLSLPETASSFGAAGSGGWLYVYGGHVTPTHAYSTQSVSGKFHRLKLDGGAAWEPLPGGPALQGMNLAAYDGKIYRAGGMQPRNKPGDKADIFSVAECARFDPASGKWETLAPLPQGRSSHDLAVVQAKLYAVGGWTMKGNAGNDWLATMAVLDLTAAKPEWKSIKQPFKRRAMSAAAFQGKLYVIGGFTEEDDATRRVDIYDPHADAWTRGPDLPEPDGNGFSPAACAMGEHLYVSVADGSLYQLDAAGKGWTKVATSTPRIVHRMVGHESSLFILGGASRGDTLNLMETVKIRP